MHIPIGSYIRSSLALLLLLVMASHTSHAKQAPVQIDSAQQQIHIHTPSGQHFQFQYRVVRDSLWRLEASEGFDKPQWRSFLDKTETLTQADSSLISRDSLAAFANAITDNSKTYPRLEVTKLSYAKRSLIFSQGNKQTSIQIGEGSSSFLFQVNTERQKFINMMGSLLAADTVFKDVLAGLAKNSEPANAMDEQKALHILNALGVDQAVFGKKLDSYGRIPVRFLASLLIGLVNSPDSLYFYQGQLHYGKALPPAISFELDAGAFYKQVQPEVIPPNNNKGLIIGGTLFGAAVIILLVALLISRKPKSDKLEQDQTQSSPEAGETIDATQVKNPVEKETENTLEDLPEKPVADPANKAAQALPKNAEELPKKDEQEKVTSTPLAQGADKIQVQNPPAVENLEEEESPKHRQREQLLTSLQKEKEKLIREKEMLQEQLEAKKVQLSAFQSQSSIIGDIQKLGGDYSSKLSAKYSLVHHFNQIHEQTIQLEKGNEKLQSENKNLQQWQNSHTQLVSAYASLPKKFRKNTLKDTIENFQAELGTLKESNSSIKTDFNRATKEANTLKKAKEKLEGELRSQKQKLDQANRELADFRSQKTQWQRAKEDLDKQISQAKPIVAQYHAVIKEKEFGFKEGKTLVENVRRLVDQFNKQFDQQEKALTTQKEAVVKQLNAQIIDLKSTHRIAIEKKETAIAKLQQEKANILQLDSAIQRLSSPVEQLDKLIFERYTLASSTQTYFKKLKQNAATYEAFIDSLTNQEIKNPADSLQHLVDDASVFIASRHRSEQAFKHLEKVDSPDLVLALQQTKKVLTLFNGEKLIPTEKLVQATISHETLDLFAEHIQQQSPPAQLEKLLKVQQERRSDYDSWDKWEAIQHVYLQSTKGRNTKILFDMLYKPVSDFDQVRKRIPQNTTNLEKEPKHLAAVMKYFLSTGLIIYDYVMWQNSQSDSVRKKHLPGIEYFIQGKKENIKAPYSNFEKNIQKDDIFPWQVYNLLKRFGIKEFDTMVTGTYINSFHLS